MNIVDVMVIGRANFQGCSERCFAFEVSGDCLGYC